MYGNNEWIYAVLAVLALFLVVFTKGGLSYEPNRGASPEGRDVIRERTMAGLEAARAHGRKGGRKPAMDEKKISVASKLMRDREGPISDV